MTSSDQAGPPGSVAAIRPVPASVAKRARFDSGLPCDAVQLGGPAQLAERTDGGRAVLVARGTEPNPGTDAHLNFGVDIEARHGTVLKDGSIDFRQRNTAAGVKAGDLIVEREPFTPGQAGRTVTGEPVPAEDGEDGEDRSLVPGQNVRMDFRSLATPLAIFLAFAVLPSALASSPPASARTSTRPQW